MSIAIDTRSVSSRKPSLLLDELLLDQRVLRTPVVEISEHSGGRFSHLIPLTKPSPGEQYAFDVNLDACTGCKACVVACHTMNGLDENESWRDVFSITDTSSNLTQTITKACHHCEDPACANGCPVLAYEKDETTGIVRHLDDQCIGCSYCMMKCPYDVPKWNVKKGIVRKCDMCQSRLSAGEAPACVQSCPNEAIRIRVVKKDADVGVLFPGAFDRSYTQPTSVYHTKRKDLPSGTDQKSEAQHHGPLAWMLVLTQLSVGGILFGKHPLACALLGALGVAISTLHLGQPLKAWRAFLGWRKSWLSREILAFGAYVPLAGLSVIDPRATPLALAAGIVSVICSIMVYVDTRRPQWRWQVTVPRFAATTLVMVLPWMLVGPLAALLVWERHRFFTR
ncbi:MAG: dimethyl sulfoxide reductase anchor subunit [Verrucomicrobiaceae bacterium]|nr:dimethyl sulfoxide reductase anchor subunit [Verrucomicrobiaceae bacterium]